MEVGGAEDDIAAVVAFEAVVDGRILGGLLLMECDEVATDGSSLEPIEPIDIGNVSAADPDTRC